MLKVNRGEPVGNIEVQLASWTQVVPGRGYGPDLFEVPDELRGLRTVDIEKFLRPSQLRDWE